MTASRCVTFSSLRREMSFWLFLTLPPSMSIAFSPQNKSALSPCPMSRKCTSNEPSGADEAALSAGAWAGWLSRYRLPKKTSRQKTTIRTDRSGDAFFAARRFFMARPPKIGWFRRFSLFYRKSAKHASRLRENARKRPEIGSGWVRFCAVCGKCGLSPKARRASE